jgi:hypothetical protein
LYGIRLTVRFNGMRGLDVRTLETCERDREPRGILVRSMFCRFIEAIITSLSKMRSTKAPARTREFSATFDRHFCVHLSTNIC